MGTLETGRAVVVGINGWGFLPADNGRIGIDRIGRGILEGINSIRSETGLPALPKAYQGLDGGDGVDQLKLRALMKSYADQPDDGLILIGYSDGATTIHREFLKGDARQTLGTTRLTFVALIDMVRVDFSPVVNIFSNQETSLPDSELIGAGKVYYQNNGLWQGYARIGPLESMQFEGVDHLTIDQSEQVIQAVIRDALNAYRSSRSPRFV